MSNYWIPEDFSVWKININWQNKDDESGLLRICCYVFDISGSQFIQDFFGWHILSGVGVLGTLSHLFLMHCFYAESTVLATSVNAMICMDTLHKLIYASIIVHWRNYAMVSGKPIFEEWLGKSNVRKHSLSLHVTIILYLFYNIAVFTCVLYTLNVSRTIVQHRH